MEKKEAISRLFFKKLTASVYSAPNGAESYILYKSEIINAEEIPGFRERLMDKRYKICRL